MSWQESYDYKVLMSHKEELQESLKKQIELEAQKKREKKNKRLKKQSYFDYVRGL